MKVKNIDIVIESEDEFFKRAGKTLSDLDKGKKPKSMKERLSFESLDALRQVLTQKRLKLLHIIKHQKPKSVYALAKITNRDLKNIRDDLSKLEALGLIELVKDTKHPRETVIPTITFDKLQVGIEI